MHEDREAAWIAGASLAAEERMSGLGAGHDFDHVCRVHRNAQKLLKAGTFGRPVNQVIVELAAWLHDVGDAKLHGGVERTAEISAEILGKIGVESEIADAVVQIVDNISFRKRDSAEPLTLEGQIVQDADRLEALGAVGIVRTVEYGQSIGQPFHIQGLPLAAHQRNEQKTGVRHFFEKLFLLPKLMNTEVGRALAESRVQVMKNFLAEFFEEVGNSGEGCQ